MLSSVARAGLFGSLLVSGVAACAGSGKSVHTGTPAADEPMDARAPATQPTGTRPSPAPADAAAPAPPAPTPPSAADARAAADGPPPAAGSDAAPVASKLEAVPAELVWSAPKGKTASQPLTLRNGAAGAASIASVTVMGMDAMRFAATPPPMLPLAIAAGGEGRLAVAFSPPAGTPSKPNRATLQIAAGAAGTLSVPLYGLPTPASDGGDEPTLKAICDTVGYAIDVGPDSLSLGLGAAPVGSEVKAQLLVRAAAGPVSMTAIARFAPDEALPYGWYQGPAPTLNELAVMQLGAHVTLFPALEPGAKTTFDPGDMPFGLYVKSKVHTTYSEDARNAANPTKHAVRVYPLRDRAGAPIPDAYLAGFEEASNGDYNDYVFVLRNVKPAP